MSNWGGPGPGSRRHSVPPQPRFQVQKCFQDLSAKRGFSIIVFNRSINRFQASLRLHLGVHWDPKVVISQGRGVKNH